ncbi:MAG TPA: hypothetical protein VG248_05205 [Caulobacteraceae bacterium]|nr:hypothetical protein [Caulobacteraceae bacterium]
MTEPAPAPAEPRVRPETRFFGWLLIVIGGLLVLLCGGCTLTLWVAGLFSLAQSPGSGALGAGISMFFLTLVIGGLPAAGGAVLAWAGWRTLHPLKTPRAVAKTFE